ncbi:MAG: DEAD/DEAH box helicase [Chlorobia bacterium]|nr:DEAD/DEAH box helicase [Fimbriimonadaceae bacterium]
MPPTNEKKTKSSPDGWLQLLHDEALRDQIVHVEEMPSREARYGDIASPMHASLKDRLEHQGLDRLFSHQAQAYDAAMEGKDLVIVTGTNSGKTLCYNLPAIQFSLSEPAARMLYLFPTKALAQDQLGRLEKLIPASVRAGTYDGDTPPSQRSSLRRLAHIVLTNPDMLHIGILPGHELWTKFFKSLRLIVIDEMHVYRGVFGSNVASVLRRLLRICEWHRSRPQIIACSATIGNPTELFERLTGRKPTLIDADGSPKGKRTFVFWNPPDLGSGQRLSTNLVSADLIAMLAELGQRTLAFSRARVSAELVLKYTREKLSKSGQVDPKKIESYRAGYTPKERRQIEQSVFKGQLLGLSATNAMELGVDIGGLDAVVMNGYPGSIASFFQQSGRAGRGVHDGLAIMVAQNDPLEQFLIRQPETLLDARNESVTINPGNPQILSQQLLCAAHERPLSPTELESFDPTALELAETMDRSGELSFRNGMFFYPSHEPPAPKVNIRGSRGEQVVLLHNGVELGTMERWRAMQNAHEGAIYLHRGATYISLELDLDVGVAHLEPLEANYYTQAIVQTAVEPQVLLRRNGVASLSGVKVTSIVIGFKRKALDGDSMLGMEDLDLPPETYDTLAVVATLPSALPGDDLARHLGGVHGAEHALMALAPLLAGCDRGDLGSSWYAFHPDCLGLAVFVYDQTPGGVGLCEKLFESFSGWTQGALQVLKSCPCLEGCPGCLLSARCEVNNDALDKAYAMSILESLRNPA